MGIVGRKEGKKREGREGVGREGKGKEGWEGEGKGRDGAERRERVAKLEGGVDLEIVQGPRVSTYATEHRWLV